MENPNPLNNNTTKNNNNRPEKESPIPTVISIEAQESTTLKVVHISDTHNKLDQIKVPIGDILIHSGDFTNKGTDEELQLLESHLRLLAHPIKILVPGNHDVTHSKTDFDLLRKMIRQNCPSVTHLLLNEMVIINGLKIWGLPWLYFHRWDYSIKKEFMAQQIECLKEQQRCFGLIPADLDILITHGPPFNHCDFAEGIRHTGSPALIQIVEKQKPKYHLFGHIHEDYGTSKNSDTVFLNSAICDFHTQPNNAPRVIQFTKN